MTSGHKGYKPVDIAFCSFVKKKVLELHVNVVARMCSEDEWLELPQFDIGDINRV